MKVRWLLSFSLCLLVSAKLGAAATGDGMPAKYISSCELDLNQDQTGDLVFLVETLQGRELIALTRGKDSGWKAFSLWTGPASNGLHLRCATGETTIKATQAASASKPGKVFKTNGAVIHLFKPESSSMAFFWDKSGFKSVSTGD